MRPETIGLLVTLFRHGRGMLSALEAWEHKQWAAKLPRYEVHEEREAVATFVRAAIGSLQDLLIDAGAQPADVNRD